MNPSLKPWLRWTPRVLCFIFACFISIFALDVFDPGQPLGKVLLAFAIHMIPTGLILLTLGLSWRWPWIGGLIYNALGVLYLIQFWGRFHWSVYVIISGSLFLIGILFLISWHYRNEPRPRIHVGAQIG